MKIIDFIVTKSGEDSVNDNAIVLKKNKSSVTLTCPAKYVMATFKRNDTVTDIPSTVSAATGAQNKIRFVTSDFKLAPGAQKTITVNETEASWNTGGSHVDILITIEKAIVKDPETGGEHEEYPGGGGGGGGEKEPDLSWVAMLVVLAAIGVGFYLAYKSGFFDKLLAGVKPK